MDTENEKQTVVDSSEPLDLASGRYFNDSALHQHALECSVAVKNGKFTRVGQDFMDEVHADVEAFIRELRNKWPVQIHDPVPCELTFTTGALMDKVQGVLNDAIARLIQRKVQRQPSCGKTLSRTR